MHFLLFFSAFFSANVLPLWDWNSKFLTQLSEALLSTTPPNQLISLTKLSFINVKQLRGNMKRKFKIGEQTNISKGIQNKTAIANKTAELATKHLIRKRPPSPIILYRKSSITYKCSKTPLVD